MRRLGITVITIFFAGAAFAAYAADDKPPRKSRRPKSSTKVITNEDVKKARGKVTELPPKVEVAPEPTASLSERHETLKRTRAAAEELVRITAAQVDSLQTELTRLERSYFDADDLDLRDGAIARRFDEARAKLAVATADLETARKALADVAQNP